MSTRLPKEVQTQKVKTLPDDLKKLAEELLGAKFGEEVVEVAESHDTFPGNQSGGFDEGFGRSFGVTEIRSRDGSYVRVSTELLDRLREANRGYSTEIEFTTDYRSSRPKARLSIPHPSMDGLNSAMRRFRNLNIRHDYVFVMNPYFADEMMRRDRDFGYYFKRNDRRRMEGDMDVYGQIMGINVIITREVKDCILEGVF